MYLYVEQAHTSDGGLHTAEERSMEMVAERLHLD